MASPRVKAKLSAVDQISGVVRKVGIGINLGLVRPLKAAASAGISTGKMFGKLGALITGATGLSGAAIAGMAGKWALNTAELSKFSKQVGLSVGDLQELEFAAERVGISNDDFRNGIKELNQRIGELRAGGGSLLGFLDKVSPALAKQIKNAKSTSEAFELITAALAQIKDPAKRAALADAAFGGAGDALVRLGDVGVKGLRELRGEQRKFGQVSEETAAKAEEFSARWIDLKAAAAGAAAEIGSELLPGIVDAAQGITDWIKANKAFIRQGLDKAIASVAWLIGEIDFEAVKAGLDQLWTAAKPLVEDVIALVRDNWPEIKAIVSAVWDFATDVTASAIALIRSTIGALVGNVRGVWDGIKAIFGGFAEWLAAVFTLDLGRAIDALATMFGGVVAIFEGIWNVVKAVFGTAIAEVGELLAKWTPEPVKAAWQSFADFMTSLWDGIKSVFADAWGFIKGIVDEVMGAVDTVVGAMRSITDAVGITDEEETPASAAPSAAASEGFASQFPIVGAPVVGAPLAQAAPVTKAEVEVTFANAPPGMTVATTTRGPSRVTADTGRRAVGVGAF